MSATVIKAQINTILEEDFNEFVNATVNMLASIVNDAKSKGKKRISGYITVGHNPFDAKNDVECNIRKQTILGILSSFLNMDTPPLSAIRKHISTLDMFEWEDDRYYDFSFKFFSSMLPIKNKTGKKFASMVNERASSLGLNLSFKWYGLVTEFKIAYSGTI